MLSKEEIELLKKLLKRAIKTKEKLEIKLILNKEVSKYLLDRIKSSEKLESAKGIKEALELANMSVKDFVYFKHRAEELEAKEQKLIEKLEERKKKNNNRYGQSIDDDEFPEMYEYSGQVQEDDYILKILKGEKE